MNAIAAFFSYLITSFVMLGLFVMIYINFTPYKEFKLIAQNNIAAAITFAGAVFGFTFPLASSVYYTQSLHEMIIWAAITCAVQLAVFALVWRQADRVEEGNIAIAVMIATLSLAVGLLNAVSISH